TQESQDGRAERVIADPSAPEDAGCDGGAQIGSRSLGANRERTQPAEPSGGDECPPRHRPLSLEQKIAGDHYWEELDRDRGAEKSAGQPRAAHQKGTPARDD